MSETHVYDMSAKSRAHKEVVIQINGMKQVEVTSARDWWPDARDGVFSPQTLLIAASASCFALTLYDAAKHVHTKFSDVDIGARGTMSEEDGVWSIDKVILKVKVTINVESDRDKVSRAIEIAHKMCPIANTLRCPTEIDYEIVIL